MEPNRSHAAGVNLQLSFSDKGPLLEKLELSEINHGSYQPLNFSPYLNCLRSILFLPLFP